MRKTYFFSVAALGLVAIAVLLPFHYVSGQSSNGNRSSGGSGSGTVSANNGSAGAVANYAAAGGSTTVGPDANLTDASNTLTYSGSGGIAATGAAGFVAGANGGSVGVIKLNGNTSGQSSITGPAVGGTATNPFVLSNMIQVPTGSTCSGGPALGEGGSGGISWIGSNATVSFCAGGGEVARFATNQLGMGTNGVIGLGSTSAPDTTLSRNAAGVWSVGTASADQGKVRAAGYISAGTTFTSNAGCGDTTLTGGATAGKYTSVTAGSCTTVITMGNSATAPNGWNCAFNDITTPANTNNIHESATNATTASINEGTVTANDVIQFSCTGY